MDRKSVVKVMRERPDGLEVELTAVRDDGRPIRCVGRIRAEGAFMQIANVLIEGTRSEADVRRFLDSVGHAR